ncbi:MAG TPA: bacteriocin [Ktedonobacterales bacterium]|jgi:bacteriocin-like protein
MTNENKKNEKKQTEQPVNIPTMQVELSDEDLKQVTGGGVIIDYGPAVQRDTIVLED